MARRNVLRHWGPCCRKKVFFLDKVSAQRARTRTSASGASDCERVLASEAETVTLMSPARVVEGSDVHLGTNATRPDDLSTLILCTFTSQKHLRSLSGSKVDPSSARASPVKRRSEHRHRHTFGRNPCTRAPLTVHSMHACTSYLHSCTPSCARPRATQVEVMGRGVDLNSVKYRSKRSLSIDYGGLVDAQNT